MLVPFPDSVRQFVESTKWTFAKTYAATWPHEYGVRTPQNAPTILALARHIFEHGIDGRFYSQVRKYHHEGGKVYWTMDDTPASPPARQGVNSTCFGCQCALGVAMAARLLLRSSQVTSKPDSVGG